MFFAGLGSIRLVKSYDRGLENAAHGMRARAAFSRRWSQWMLLLTARSEISGNIQRKMERYFPIKPGQPMGMALVCFVPFPKSLFRTKN